MSMLGARPGSGATPGETYLSMCTICGQPVRVVVRRKYVTPIFNSKEVGRNFVNHLLACREIGGLETMDLLSGLNRSQLPDEATTAEMLSDDSLMLEISAIPIRILSELQVGETEYANHVHCAA